MKNEIRKKSKLIENYKLWAFILGMLLYFLFLSYSQMAGGKYSIFRGDAIEGQIATIKSFCRSLFSGESIIYSWNYGLGLDTFSSYVSSAILTNITSVFYLLFSNSDFGAITVISLVLKAGLSSLAFYIYFERAFGIKGVMVLLFSLMYSMNAFQVLFSSIILTWSDAIFMLPIILMLIHEFADDNKWKLLVVAYAYIFLNVFYMGYVIGFFSFLYLVLYLGVIKKQSLKSFFKIMIKFAGVVILSAGLCAVFLFPTAVFLLLNRNPDATAFYDIKVNIFDIYNQLFIGQNIQFTVYNDYPYIYCGIITLIMFPLFFVDKTNEKKQKIFYGILLAIMVLSCIINPLFMFWHLFDMPDGWTYRFSYIISFLLCILACKVCNNIKKISYKPVMLLALFDLSLYFSLIYIRKNPDNSNDLIYFGINLFFIGVYFLILYMAKKENNNERLKGIVAVLLLVVSIEMVFNAYSLTYKIIGTRPYILQEEYTKWISDMNANIDSMDDEGFYRTDVQNDLIMNGSIYWGYNGINYFSNMENYSVRETLGKLGLYTSPRLILSFGMTDFTKMLLGVRYEIYNGEMSEFPYYMPLGFVVDDSLLDFSFSGDDVFVNINELASSILGDTIELYEKSINDIKFYQEGINLVTVEDVVYLVADEEREGAKYLLITTPSDERQAYIQFDQNGYSIASDTDPLLIDGNENIAARRGRISVSYIKEMNKYLDCYETSVVMLDKINTICQFPENMNIYYYNEDIIDEIYDRLNDNVLTVLDYGNDYVDAYICIDEVEQLVFLSIPYDEGWSVYDNGEKIDTYPVINDTFIAIYLSNGEHNLHFKYENKWIKYGLLVSTSALVIFIFLIIISKKNERNK